MGGITRQLKSYARKGDVDAEPVDLRDSVRSRAGDDGAAAGQDVGGDRTTLPSEPVMVKADPLRIEQIIVNLLRNALDAVRNGATIRRSRSCWWRARRTCSRSTTTAAGSTDPDKLFEPFYTTKKAGEGWASALPFLPASPRRWEGGSWRAMPRTAARSSTLPYRAQGATQAAE